MTTTDRSWSFQRRFAVGYLCLAAAAALTQQVESFVVPIGSRSYEDASTITCSCTTKRAWWRLKMTSTNDSSVKDASTMRVSEIRDELKQLQIDFSDCFDKESLMLRLQDARTGKVQPSGTAGKKKTESAASTTSSTRPSSTTAAATTTATTKISSPDSKELLQEIRAMTVRALREELASRRMRWAGMLEKEELVQAVLRARLEAANFSVTGKLAPGLVGDLTGDELQQELEVAAQKGDSDAVLLLLDVYATWCGPCQLVAPQLKEAAAVFGTTVQVAKMDSDKHHEASAKLRVQGLPTLVLFRNGQEIDRIEGALMKDQIVDWVNNKLR